MRACRVLAILSLGAIILLQGCADVSRPVDGSPKQFVGRQIIVTVSANMQDQWEDLDRDIRKLYGIEKTGEFPLTSLRVNCLVYRIPTGISMERVVREISLDRRVQLVERNQIFESMLSVVGDPFARLEYGVNLIGADQAQLTSLGRGIQVAVIDTGMDRNHPDLRPGIVDTQNFVEGGEESFNLDGHGTAVAGIIGAQANDGMGIFGIAPRVGITALKACWYGNVTDFKAHCASWTLAKALDYAITHKARVVNLSVAGPNDALLGALINEAHRKGIVMVASANEARAEPGFPAGFDHVVPVISANGQSSTTHPSWLSATKAIAAPGKDILTTMPKQGYEFLSGSSLAAAHVTGVIALMLERRPDLTPDEVRQILFATAIPDSGGSAPVVNACRALQFGYGESEQACNDWHPVRGFINQARMVSDVSIEEHTPNATSASTNDFDTGSSRGFFSELGSNGRSCSTCHRRDQAWSFTPAYAQELAAQNPADPLFNPVDGSDCPHESASQPPDAGGSSLLTRYGVIRVQLPIPEHAEFALADASNPSHCSAAPGDKAVNHQLFLYRRPLPPTNLAFLSSVMWDGRKSPQPVSTEKGFANTAPLLASLMSQANDGILKHAQGGQPISGTQAHADILAFEVNLYSAQSVLDGIPLDQGANGGPRYVAEYLAPNYFAGQNDTFSGDFDSRIFNLYSAWEPGASGSEKLTEIQQAIGRGEAIFNNRKFVIANVAGLNSASNDPIYNPHDPFSNKPIIGTCGTCHNTPNMGNHSSLLPLNIGVAMARPIDNNGAPIAVLDTARLPRYKLRPTNDREALVTDPGRALVSGMWADIGKFNTPVLRGLNGRAPYFHNGSAKDLETVIQYYNSRFDMELTAADMRDLVIFLKAL